MIAARKRFLASGVYDRIADAVAEQCVGDVLCEVGAGTGFYLARCLERLNWRESADPSHGRDTTPVPEPAGLQTDQPLRHDRELNGRKLIRFARGIATDVSTAAAKAAAKAHDRIASVVADVWEGLPVKTGQVTTLLCVFAPRNLDEFVRVVAVGGRVIVVVPNLGHLAGVRHQLGLLDIRAGKIDDITRKMPDVMRLVGQERIQFTHNGSPDQINDLIAMGPNAFHRPPTVTAGASIDVDVGVLVWKKTGV
jgi:23S rRNA (guanine745-N1)-methyltransferase